MPQTHVLTYATHSAGSFESLRTDVPSIVVLGWGRRWTGFFDKVHAVLDAVREYDEDDEVLFVDGFDVRVRDQTAAFAAWHRAVGSQQRYMLFSRHHPTLRVPFADYLVRRCFGGVVNSGTYVGRAGDLRRFLEDVVAVRRETFGDDQRAFNRVLCTGTHPHAVDHANAVFRVESLSDEHTRYAAPVVHRPGSRGAGRWFEGVVQYAPFLLPELALIAGLLVYVGTTIAWSTP
jgi:hypothetical protein